MQSMTFEQLQKAHELADYNEWLAAEIQEALDDPRPNSPHEEVMSEMKNNLATTSASLTGSETFA